MSSDLTPDDPASGFALGVHTLSAGFPKAWIDIRATGVLCRGNFRKGVMVYTLCGKQKLLLALEFTLLLWLRVPPGK